MRREIPLWTLRWCVRPSITVSSTGVAIARSLRGTILARPTPSCAHDNDRVRLPPASPPRNSKTGKRINGPPPQPTLPAVRQAILELSLDYRHNDARITENGFATSSGVNKSAKVV